MENLLIIPHPGIPSFVGHASAHNIPWMVLFVECAVSIAARLRQDPYSASRFFLATCSFQRFSRPPRVLGMNAEPQRSKGRDGVLSSLNMAIEAMNLAKEVSRITPATAAFVFVGVLAMIMVNFFLYCLR